MEEKKTKKGSESTDSSQQRLSYEELQRVAGELQQQNIKMKQMLQQANYTNVFKRLDYLFKVLDTSVMFKDEFVDSVAREIEQTLTIPESETSQEENGEA